MKTAREKDLELLNRLLRITDNDARITTDVARTLRRAALTLHRWGELECGDGNDYASWSIERDETTDLPYFCRYPHDSSKVFKHRIADREKGALRRIKQLCDNLGLHFYYQTDPRGWPLYVSNEPLTDQNYNNGVGIGS